MIAGKKTEEGHLLSGRLEAEWEETSGNKQNRKGI